jgi:putative hydrolase
MSPRLPVAEPPEMDMQVHSTFSDGKNTVEENVAEAEAMRLHTMTCVDHVRADTRYLPEFVATVRRLQETTDVRLLCAAEAKFLDDAGHLDLPGDLAGVDRIYAGDHQVPWTDGPRHPDAVADELARGVVTHREVLEHLTTATANAVRRHENVVIAHFFSLLPRLGIDEQTVPLELIEHVADAAREGGAIIEVNERYRSPNARTLRPFLARGIELFTSTDAHQRDRIARYDHVATVVRELAADPG